jgi:hypothetical protein
MSQPSRKSNALSFRIKEETMKRFLFSGAIVTIGLATLLLPGVARPQEEKKFSFNLVPASAAIEACLPNASAEVTVSLKEAITGTDTLELNASGLPPNTTFVVFLTELPEPPFGAVQYIGDYTTNAQGIGHVRINTIVEEAFSSQLVDTDCDPTTPDVRVRKELNHVVNWFADPEADDFCFGPGQPPTPFDGDGEAGNAVLSSRNALPGAPIP